MAPANDLNISNKTITRLPAHVTDTVRSSAQAADLPSAACQLVLNSIQAGARSICVTANIAAWSLTVEDDGCGIAAASFPLLGQRFCTAGSKPAAAAGPPRKGEALASLAQLSQQVSITSRAAGAFETHRKVLHASSSSAAAQHSTAPSTTLCPIPRQRHGTTVCLTGFLHSQPVRRNRLLQQYAGIGAAAAHAGPPSTAAWQAAAAMAARASASCLQELRQALFVLMLPHTGVELVLQQAGSSSSVLHMPQVRCWPWAGWHGHMSCSVHRDGAHPAVAVKHSKLFWHAGLPNHAEVCRAVLCCAVLHYRTAPWSPACRSCSSSISTAHPSCSTFTPSTAKAGSCGAVC